MAKRVLVIDDDAGTRFLVRHTLEARGYSVEELASAQEVEIGDPAPDLVLSDVMLPGRDGISLCRDLRNDPRTREIPVVLISAKGFEADRRAARDAGASGYVQKPFTPEDLVRVVEEALATRTRLRVWGCRGSIPSPERAVGRYGGNTLCLDLLAPGGRHLIFDAGTGIRALGNLLVREPQTSSALLLTHYHWDHIQGLPFFKPLYLPGTQLHIYGPADSSEHLAEILAGQMGSVFFPVSMDALRSSLRFFAIQEQSWEALGVSISTLYVLHPGRTVAYRVTVGDRSLVYAPDHEILPECAGAELSGEALRFARFAAGASLLIHDAAYTRPVYETRRGWGHSCGESLAAVAAAAGVERVLLFHHDPDSSDEEVEEVHREFERALRTRGADIPSEPAREGMTFTL